MAVFGLLDIGWLSGYLEWIYGASLCIVISVCSYTGSVFCVQVVRCWSGWIWVLDLGGAWRQQIWFWVSVPAFDFFQTQFLVVPWLWFVLVAGGGCVSWRQELYKPSSSQSSSTKLESSHTTQEIEFKIKIHQLQNGINQAVPWMFLLPRGDQDLAHK